MTKGNRRLRQHLPIAATCRLRIEGETDKDASVTLGRNVCEGIFVGARQGLGGQGSAVVVEVEVFDGVVVDTEVDQEGGSNIGITLRYDF